MEVSEKEWKELKKKREILRKSAEILRVDEKDLPRVIQRFLDEIKEMDGKLKSN